MKAPARTRSIRLTRPQYDRVLKVNRKLLQLAFEQCATKVWDLQGVVLTGIPRATYDALHIISLQILDSKPRTALDEFYAARAG